MGEKYHRDDMTELRGGLVASMRAKLWSYGQVSERKVFVGVREGLILSRVHIISCTGQVYPGSFSS